MTVQLRSYQLECSEKLGRPELVSRLIGDEMGTGKTIECLDIDKRLRKARADLCYLSRRTLIVAPLSVHEHWAEHIRMVFGANAKIFRIDRGDRAAFIKALRGNHSFYICHWEALRLKDTEKPIRQVAWFHVIADEVHRAKSRKAQQTRALKQLRPVYKTGASGTPADNKPQDLWSILNWLYPKKWPSYWRFANTYCRFEEVKNERTGQVFRKIVGVVEEALPQLHKEMAPFYIRRLKEQVLPDLPEKYYCTPLETPIMMADLSFRPIGEIEPGDVVMGWDEATKIGGRRQLRPARVSGVGRLQRPLIRAHLDSGRSIRCTPDHLWRSGIKTSTPWVQLGKHEDLRKNRPKTILRVVDELPRELTPNEREAALWLGGLLDGEGSFTVNGVEGSGGYHWSVHQSKTKNPQVWTRLRDTLQALDIPYVHDISRNDLGPEDNFRFRTDRTTALKLLTWCKPVKHRDVLERRLRSGFTPDRVVLVESEPGLYEVAWLETETGNYVAWGYASKNSPIDVVLPPRQRRAYDQMRKHMLAWVGENEDQELSAPAVIAQLVRLQQFALASPRIEWKRVITQQERKKAELEGRKPEPEKIMTVVLEEPSAKLDALQEIIEDNGNEQHVVFSQSRSMIDLVEARLEKSGLRVAKYTGRVPNAVRDAELEAFQRGERDVFAATIAAGGESIDLTASSTAHFLDRHWSPSRNKQAEDRLHRFGQKNAVQVINYIAKNTVDLGRLQQIASKWTTLRLLLGDETKPEVYLEAVRSGK